VFKFADARRRVKMLLNGDLDMITNFEALDLRDIEKQGFKTIKEPSFTTMSINFNLRYSQGPFQNKLVRQAVNYAIDKGLLIEKVKLGFGIGRATLGMPGEYGYNPYIKPYPYDPEKG
jgi:peptide/nickel transport system substrate-binding protein